MVCTTAMVTACLYRYVKLFDDTHEYVDHVMLVMKGKTVC